MDNWLNLLPSSLLAKYEMHNFNPCVEVLSLAYASGYAEIIAALENFTITIPDIAAGGGSKRAMHRSRYRNACMSANESAILKSYRLTYTLWDGRK